VLTGPHVILLLKIAVLAVTVLLLLSLFALSRGRYRIHGWINLTCFVLTVLALIGLEVVARLIDPELFSYFDSDPELRRALGRHILFSVPAAIVMPLMLFTGLSHRRAVHLALSAVFSVLWIGTFVTGVFFLPHTP
jgi:uncharacterized membrane protein YozB (DUF420 family)